MAIGGEKALLLAVMRNEGPYVIEWLAHHFALGIDDVLVFTNFCTDNTDKIKSGIQNVTEAAMKLGEAIYKSSMDEASGEPAAADEDHDDDIVDAEFEDLDDNKRA